MWYNNILFINGSVFITGGESDNDLKNIQTSYQITTDITYEWQNSKSIQSQQPPLNNTMTTSCNNYN